MTRTGLILLCLAQAASAGDPAWLSRAVAQTKKTLARLGAAPSSASYPSKTAKNAETGEWEWATSSGWTSGFFPGTLWLLANRTGDAELFAAAKAYTAGRAVEANNTGTHDVGFMVFDSFGKGIELGGAALSADERAAYGATVQQAAASLASRYSDVVQMTRSWGQKTDDKQFEVIIDNLMNLELLFWAAEHAPTPTTATATSATTPDAARLREIAVNTATNMGRYWIRPDGSTFHLVVFDPTTGAVQSRSGTPQGLATNSTWARGQAWGVYGFTMAYRYTQDPRYLDLARNVTRFYLANLPADSVPKWDFSATAAWGGPNRDTSAAAITASGLLELHGYTGEQAFLDAARAALAALVGVGYALPEASGESLLTHCFHDCGDDECAIVEADYYLVEALLRAEKLGVRL